MINGKVFRLMALCLIMVFVSASMFMTVSAEDVAATEETAEESGNIGSKAVSAAIVAGLGAAAGAVAMGLTISKSVEGMSRQPEASGKINSAMMLGLVFIETAIIYALIVAILIIFVL